MQTPVRVSKQPKKEMDAEMPKRGENERKSKEKRMTKMTEMAEKTDDRDNFVTNKSPHDSLKKSMEFHGIPPFHGIPRGVVWECKVLSCGGVGVVGWRVFQCGDWVMVGVTLVVMLGVMEEEALEGVGEVCVLLAAVPDRRRR